MTETERGRAGNSGRMDAGLSEPRFLEPIARESVQKRSGREDSSKPASGPGEEEKSQKDPGQGNREAFDELRPAPEIRTPEQPERHPVEQDHAKERMEGERGREVPASQSPRGPSQATGGTGEPGGPPKEAEHGPRAFASRAPKSQSCSGAGNEHREHGPEQRN